MTVPVEQASRGSGGFGALVWWMWHGERPVGSRNARRSVR